jgi:hypothetical protein
MTKNLLAYIVLSTILYNSIAKADSSSSLVDMKAGYCLQATYIKINFIQSTMQNINSEYQALAQKQLDTENANLKHIKRYLTLRMIQDNDVILSLAAAKQQANDDWAQMNSDASNCIDNCDQSKPMYQLCTSK